jgi:hypothetical protein
MNRLEKVFNGGIEIGDELRLEYYNSLQYVDPTVFRDAVQFVVETFKPFPSEIFPAISTIEAAILETRETASVEAGWETRRQPPPDPRASDYCQRCGNVGFYLAGDGQARFCRCEKGRIKRISWYIEPGVRKREEKIQKALEKIPPSQGPVRGLHKWNPTGFWEDTQEEHDRWMAAKRDQIAELERRRPAQPEKTPSSSDELRFKLLHDTVAKIKFQDRFMPVAREPGEDEEDDEVPF